MNYGIYKAALDKPEALKKLEAIRKSLKRQGIPFEEQAMETDIVVIDWGSNDERTTAERTRVETIQAQVIFVTGPATKTPKPPKRVKNNLYDPWQGPPSEYEYSAEDLAFFTETEKLRG